MPYTLNGCTLISRSLRVVYIRIPGIQAASSLEDWERTYYVNINPGAGVAGPGTSLKVDYHEILLGK